jgi:hypothetical protein
MYATPSRQQFGQRGLPRPDHAQPAGAGDNQPLKRSHMIALAAVGAIAAGMGAFALSGRPPAPAPLAQQDMTKEPVASLDQHQKSERSSAALVVVPVVVGRPAAAAPSPVAATPPPSTMPSPVNRGGFGETAKVNASSSGGSSVVAT